MNFSRPKFRQHSANFSNGFWKGHSCCVSKDNLYNVNTDISVGLGKIEVKKYLCCLTRTCSYTPPSSSFYCYSLTFTKMHPFFRGVILPNSQFPLPWKVLHFAYSLSVLTSSRSNECASGAAVTKPEIGNIINLTPWLLAPLYMSDPASLLTLMFWFVSLETGFPILSS